MKYVRAYNHTQGVMLGDRIGVADRWWLRLRGLLGRTEMRPGEGLLLVPCAAVHTLGMRFAIDVAFLDGAGKVVAMYAGLEPGRFSRRHPGARSALELPPGTLENSGTGVGDLLQVIAHSA